MVTGQVPFKAPNMQDLHKQIKSGEFTFPKFDNGPELSEEIKSLISGLI
jgi:hypothetical protein